MDLLAAIPLLVALTLGLAQLLVAGYALWSAGEAARAGARAEHVGRDGTAVAEATVPRFLGPPHVRADGGVIRVAIDAPALLPGLPEVPVDASAALDPAGETP